MASKIEIVNLALTHIGARALSSLSETSEGARKVAVVYDMTLDEVLRAYDWTFAAKTSALALLDEDSLEWDFVYTRPSNCLRVRRVLNELTDPTAPPEKFRERMSPDTNVRSIECNVEDAYAEFTYRVIDTTQYDSSFIMALSYRLAAELAKPLTGNDQLAAQMFAIYQNLISEAGRINAGGDKPQDIIHSPFKDCR